MSTARSRWTRSSSDRGSEIDLLIDRADDIISVCELKFTDETFAITKRYAEELRNKIAAFRQQSGTRKGIHLVFVTSYGLAKNRYSDGLVDQTITMEGPAFVMCRLYP